MMTITALAAVATFITAVIAGAKPDLVPLWVAVVLAAVTLCLVALPK